MKKPLYKKWWGVLVILLLLPFFLTYYIWKKQNWTVKKKLFVIVGMWLAFFVLGALAPDSKTPTQSATRQMETTQPATVTQTPVTSETKTNPGSTKRASTPEAEALYKQIEDLYTDGAVKGKLFAEFEGDPIVDANPQTQSVQLGLQYDYEGKLTRELKAEIGVDYDMIKSLAEENSRLLMPGTKQLRLFVLTFHDKTGVGRGEVQQLYIDDEPQWSEWK